MKLRFVVASSLLCLTVPNCPLLVRAAHAQAPLAKLTKVQQKVEISSGVGAAFRAIQQGASVGRGSVVRTGRRSKADVKFSDGSLVRLGQLSSIEVRGPRNVQIGSGQALISWLSPGKIGTSYAAAEIKGTIVNISVTDEGTTFTLYEGATEIVTTAGNRQELKPGTEVFARPDGTLSGLRTAAPIFFAQAGSPIELLNEPKTGAFAGSVADVEVKSSPARVVQRETVAQLKSTEQTPGFNPGQPNPAPTTPAPTTPAPTTPVPTTPAPTTPVPTTPAPTTPEPTTNPPTTPATPTTNPPITPENPATPPVTTPENSAPPVTPENPTPPPTTENPTTPPVTPENPTPPINPTTPPPATPENPTTPTTPSPTNPTSPNPTDPPTAPASPVTPTEPASSTNPTTPPVTPAPNSPTTPTEPTATTPAPTQPTTPAPTQPTTPAPTQPTTPAPTNPTTPTNPTSPPPVTPTPTPTPTNPTTTAPEPEPAPAPTKPTDGGKDDKADKDKAAKDKADEDNKAAKDKAAKDEKEAKDKAAKDGKGKSKDDRVLARTSSVAGYAASGANLLSVSSSPAGNVSGRFTFSSPLGARPDAQTVSNRAFLVQLPPIPAIPGDSADNDALIVNKATNELGFDSRRAQQRLDELSGAGGKASGFDARAIGILGDGGNTAYGARIRGYVARGNFLLDGAIQPLKVQARGQNFDLSAVSDLSLTYRTPNIEVQGGRQRFLSGPTQATLYGSLVRQGGREIMDALRVSKTLGAARQQRVDLAYLVDAYPRNLPFRVSGLQSGFLARYSVQKKANIGLNAIKYFNLDRSNQLGVSLDAAVPLGESGVDLYGEVGRDTYGRNLSSAGLSFPGLYARTGFDVYLEAAYVGSSSHAARPPAEFALRAYRRLNDNVDLVTSISRFSNGNTSALIGLSFGSKLKR